MAEVMTSQDNELREVKSRDDNIDEIEQTVVIFFRASVWANGSDGGQTRGGGSKSMVKCSASIYNT